MTFGKLFLQNSRGWNSVEVGLSVAQYIVELASSAPR
jgi:hypothetical protein